MAVSRSWGVTPGVGSDPRESLGVGDTVLKVVEAVVTEAAEVLSRSRPEESLLMEDDLVEVDSLMEVDMTELLVLLPPLGFRVDPDEVETRLERGDDWDRRT